MASTLLSRYEHRSEPILPTHRFLRRIGSHVGLSLLLVAVSLLIGTIGYHFPGQERWIDAFLDAAMLLGGMGQVGIISSDGGKIFAGIFALYSGLLLIVVTTIVMAPVLHRILHRIHLEGAEVEESDEG